MSADTFFRMGVLNAVLQVQDYRLNQPGRSLEEACRLLQRGLSSTASFDYSRSLDLLRQNPSLQVRKSAERHTRLRSLLEDMILTLRPTWARLIPNGRRYLSSFIIESDAHHCLVCAGLYGHSKDSEIPAWWDRVSQSFRASHDDAKNRIGRDGERLSLEYEQQRLAKECISLSPEWVAIEDNTLGYDIESYRTVGKECETIYIEVKSTTSSRWRFILTRHEWDTALRLQEKYTLHLWKLTTRELKHLDFNTLSLHVPQDNGQGRWEKVLIVLN